MEQNLQDSSAERPIGLSSAVFREQERENPCGIAYGQESFEQVSALVRPCLAGLYNSPHRFQVLTTCAGGGAGVTEIFTQLPGSTRCYISGSSNS